MQTETQTTVRASELRIGNWVEFDAGHSIRGRIEYIAKNQIRIDTWAGSEPGFAHVQAIPLSPEILGKAGFKKTGAHSKDWILHLKEGYLGAWTGEEPCAWHSIEVNDIPYSTHSSEIEYLHQLQNLYFALTGEELKIEL